MKPNFALILSSEAIGLLHRTPRGWMPVGEVETDGPDLDEGMAFLRTTAQELCPQGFTTKLILPNDQILYTEVDAPGPETGQRRRQIRRALEGLTPYGLDEIVFDWWGTGSSVQVAVVARETLQEAEAFASAHRMNPVSFVAMPPAGRFGGEPFFGQAQAAGKLLPAGESVSRDQDPVTILLRDLTERSESPVEPAEAVAAEAAPAPAEAPAEAQPEAPEMPAMAAEPPAAVAAEAAEPAAAPEPMAVPEPPPAPAAPAPEPAVAAAAAPEPQAEDDPFAADRAEAASDAAAKAFGAPPATDLPVEVPAEAPAPTFSSRRRDDTAAAPAPKVAITTATAPGGRARTLLSAAPPEPPVTAAPEAPCITATVVPLQAKPVVPAAPAPAAPAAAARAPALAPAPGKGAKPKSALVTATAIPGRRVEARPQPTTAARPSETSGLSARGPKQRGKPRYLGLILTGALLLFLFLVAAWSSVYLTRETAPESDTAPLVAAPPEAAAGTDVAATLPAEGEVDPEMLADLAAMGEPLDPVAEATPPEEPVAAAPVPEPAPQTSAETSTAAIAAPGLAGQDEIFLAAIDAAPPVVDALLLPPAAVADAAPGAQMPPPPFGTVYSFDTEGRIVAPPEGIVTPEGVWLIAARPPVIPPPRPASAADPSDPPDPALSPETTAAVDPAADAFQPAPSTLRPPGRPAGLAPPAAPLRAEDDAGLATPTDLRLASFRPAPRPDSVLRDAPSAEDASLVTASAAAPADPSNPLALAVSKRPAPRPDDLSRAVEAAVAAAVRPADPVPEAEPEAPNPNLSPEELAEDTPEDRPSAAPRIPTNASVAKQATFANAINLSKINLIGIYGTASNRYALVRLASGRYVKVGVGDRVDGGKVAAITTSELRYQKGGRLVTLAMPKG